MNCNCIKDLEQMLAEKLKGEGDFGKIKPKGATLKRVCAANVALMMSDFKYKLQIPFTADWTIPGRRDKSTTANLLASHCPFCGQPIQTPKQEAASATLHAEKS